MKSTMQPLPIDSLLPEIVATLKRVPNLVIEAPPGAGKTTRVPPALLRAGLAGKGEVWVLEPRRLAARLAARRVAEELGEKVGETAGYQVRFEDVSGPRTRLRFLTEGLLTRRLLSDPQLRAAGLIVLDEFHERHLSADLALALLKRVQREARPDLRIVAMSATLDATPVASFLYDCLVLRSTGRRFEVHVEHLTRTDERPLEWLVERAVRRLLVEGLDGDVLVFLPGATEIRRAREACVDLAAQFDLLVLPLHGDLSLAEQDRAVLPAAKQKVILSTNVAETSLTIEGVAAVIDSGLARVAGHSPWSGLPTLHVERVSRASAVQRAGRAGRTRVGRCLRLYTAPDFAARPEYATPEIRRLDLTGPALELHAAGVADLKRFEWYESPPPASLDAADALLKRLGAIDERKTPTRLGERMLTLPLHPRPARVLIEAERRGVAREGCLVAALLGERDIRERQVFSEPREGQRVGGSEGGASDLLALLALFVEAESRNFSPEVLRRLGLNPGAVRAVERASSQLRNIINRETAATKRINAETSSPLDREERLLVSILAGYPDRVARRRAAVNQVAGDVRELLLANGSGALLASESVVRQSEFLVACDAEERRETTDGRLSRRAGKIVVRLASHIEPEWLLDLFAEAISETTEVKWNAPAERVEAFSRLLYGQLILDERPANAFDGEAVARVLAEAASSAGPPAFVDQEVIDQLLARISFVAEHFPEAGFPQIGGEDVRDSLIDMCENRRSFAELRAAARAGELLNRLREKLNAAQSRLLATMAPERLTLKGGRQARVRYEPGQPPWIASRLQDFFGMLEGPKVAGGRVPLVLHLLAPNQRPVQVTSDLPGFWSRHYPQVRRELGRRYPRHAWPEDPVSVINDRKKAAGKR